MSQKIWVSVSWQQTGGNPGGGITYQGTGTAFDTDTKTIGAYSSYYYAALFDPAPQGFTLAVGYELWYECDASCTKTTWVYDGGTATHTTTEANSPTCGYTPPLSCDLGTATVSQQQLPSGVRVTVTFTGTSNAPAYYALDGGLEQTSPLFSQVAPGQHQVKVRDSGLSGCQRLVSFTVAAPPTLPTPPAAPTGPPQDIDLAGQPLFYTLPPQAAGAAVTLELWAESAHYAGDYQRVVTLRRQADAQGHVRFRLDPLLGPLLAAWQPPQGLHPVNQVSQPCAPNLVNYYVRTSSLAPAAGALPVYQVSGIRAALRGGLPAEWQGTNFFLSRLTDFDLPPFLSWQPTGAGMQAAGQAKAVVPRQPEWLFWLVPAEVGSQALRVRRSYRLSETAAPVSDYEPLATPTGGWGLRLLAIPLKDARAGFASLRIQVETSAGVALSPEAAFRFVEPSPRTRFLLFTNSLGGLDTLRCEGRLEATLEATADALERPVLGPPGTGAPVAERGTGTVTAGRKLKLQTGWLSPAELLWVQELVLARDIWQQATQQLRRLEWPKRSLVFLSDEPGPRGLLLEFDYAYDPTAYAPITHA